jgi:hypothetical protein
MSSVVAYYVRATVFPGRKNVTELDKCVIIEDHFSGRWAPAGKISDTECHFPNVTSTEGHFLRRSVTG